MEKTWKAIRNISLFLIILLVFFGLLGILGIFKKADTTINSSSQNKDKDASTLYDEVNNRKIIQDNGGNNIISNNSSSSQFSGSSQQFDGTANSSPQDTQETEDTPSGNSDEEDEHPVIEYNIYPQSNCTEESRLVESCEGFEEFPVCGWVNLGQYYCGENSPCVRRYKNPCEACMNSDVNYWTPGECPSHDYPYYPGS